MEALLYTISALVSLSIYDLAAFKVVRVCIGSCFIAVFVALLTTLYLLKSVINHPFQAACVTLTLVASGDYFFRRLSASVVPSFFDDIALEIHGSRQMEVVAVGIVLCAIFFTFSIVAYFDSPSNQPYIATTVVLTVCIAIYVAKASIPHAVSPALLFLGRLLIGLR